MTRSRNYSEEPSGKVAQQYTSVQNYTKLLFISFHQILLTIIMTLGERLSVREDICEAQSLSSLLVHFCCDIILHYSLMAINTIKEKTFRKQTRVWGEWQLIRSGYDPFRLSSVWIELPYRIRLTPHEFLFLSWNLCNLKWQKNEILIEMEVFSYKEIFSQFDDGILFPEFV